MAILIVEHNGTVEGASLNGRVLIGRRASNHVVLDHPDVSRIHAWIDTAGRQFCLTDAGSRTGTFLNGHRVTAKVPLKHGDRITLGPAALTFRADASLPAGVSRLDFAPRAAVAADDGILFDCACGAPLWVPASFAGKTGMCRFCGTAVTLPPPGGRVDGGAAANPRGITTAPAPGAAPAARANAEAAPPAVPTRAPAPPAPLQGAGTAVTPAGAAAVAPTRAAAAATATCGACQSTITPGEAFATCPACGLTFHADCWAENYGCSAYGCSQVNALLPKTPLAETAAPGDTDPPPAAGAAAARLDETDGGDAGGAARAEQVPRAYLLLAGSVIGLIAGAFTFGVPALVALVAGLAYLRRGSPAGSGAARHRGVAWAAVLLAVVGAGVGAAVSYVWWLGGGGGEGTAL
jgi:hypothetical protein